MSLTLLNADGAEWYPILFDTPSNIVRSVAIWLTLALIVAFVAVFFALTGDARRKFGRISLFVAIAYACVLGVLFLSLSFAEDGIVTLLFVPLLVLLVVLAASGIALCLRRDKAVVIAAACLSGAALIAVLVCIGVNYASGASLDANWLTGEDVNTVALYVFAAVLVAVMIALAFILGRHDRKGFDTRAITFAAVCIAMSFALSYLKVVEMPYGGSITVASLLPLMIYSYMFGVRKGVFAGMIYGILQAFQDTYILHPAQFLLDYPIAFSAIGLAGVFAQTKALRFPQVRFALGAIVAGFGRFVMHFISGIFAFGAFAPEGQPVVVYSLLYNLGYVFTDIAIVVVVGVLVFSSKAFIREMDRAIARNRTAAPAAAIAAETAATVAPAEEHVFTCPDCGAKFKAEGNVASCPYCNRPIEENTKSGIAAPASDKR